MIGRDLHYSVYQQYFREICDLNTQHDEFPYSRLNLGLHYFRNSAQDVKFTTPESFHSPKPNGHVQHTGQYGYLFVS